MGRKIQREEENPIDNLLYDISEYISPTFYKLNFTPNLITLLSFLNTLVSLFFFNKDKPIYGSIFLIISYFFDCLDGYFARKYNMISKIGDYLDHGTDLFLIIGLFYLLYNKNDYTIFKIKFVILLFLGLLSMLHLGCQERIHDQKHSPSLSFTKLVAPCDKTTCKNLIKHTRYFGMGTIVLITCTMFLF